MPGSFFDTNVIVYLGSADPAKAGRVAQLVAGGGTISVQVLNETANVARRKMGLSWDETHRFLDTIRALLSVVPLTVETHARGLELAEQYGLPIYDALIVAAAAGGGCDILWSADMQHAMSIDGALRIANPFSP
jgi:predicted nucleic acid-binding protein